MIRCWGRQSRMHSGLGYQLVSRLLCLHCEPVELRPPGLYYIVDGRILSVEQFLENL